MHASITAAIQDAEERLRQAMLSSGIAALEALLHPDLLFVNHMGWTVTREDDLDAHRGGLLKLHALDLSEQCILPRADCAVVSVLARIAGSYNGVPANGTFRFMRTWAPDSGADAAAGEGAGATPGATAGAWRVIAASSVMVV
ncbi:nuclear transport factor 2 family protein [Achromobacter animicus]|uniref:nuclear transport factor 2 family protein n=1 Tax=Achromobacter animicus TaxID=1389935 RepID=UPI00244D0BA0|nr:nuclear transport factor 2 family protein [Achromobacter animicus]MDH0684207.1 nuclear transport factor 2 family protein [Achromobacter animicus]